MLIINMTLGVKSKSMRNSVVIYSSVTIRLKGASATGRPYPRKILLSIR